MKTKFLIFGFIVLINNIITAQEKNSWNHSAGINLLQIPATTMDLQYELSNNPRYSLFANGGLTFNYIKAIDLIGFFLSPHYKCGNDGYALSKQSGSFFALGARFNFRKSDEIKSYVYMSVSSTNSLVFEKGEMQNMEIEDSQSIEIYHYIFLLGIKGAIGSEFQLSNKLKADFEVSFSLPSKNYEELYGYNSYIPGMGFMETCGGESLFPMISLRLKYRLH